MQFSEFKNLFKNAPVIISKDILPDKKDKQAVLNQLGRWASKGLLVQLKKGMYLLGEGDRKIHPNRLFLANQIYGPSYVSLEYALSFYDLIPERVEAVTSVTTRKTKTFKNPLGQFTYQHLKPLAFRGFRAQKDETGLSFFIADPEKAVVDFVYLNLHLFSPGDQDIFEQSYRFQNLDILKPKKMKEMTQLFDNKKLIKVIGTFCDFAKGQKTP